MWMHAGCAKRYAEEHPDAEMSSHCCMCKEPFRIEDTPESPMMPSVTEIAWEPWGDDERGWAHTSCVEANRDRLVDNIG